MYQSGPTSILAGAERKARSDGQLVIEHCRHRYDPALEYFLYRPPETTPDTPVVVSVHGISRNAVEHAESFAPHAYRHGALVVAPHFSVKGFGDYQRLGRRGRGGRADLALEAILAEVGEATGVDTAHFYLNGYSGGAQFAHRFALAYPHKVRSLAICAAGWYTMPRTKWQFPHGLGSDPDLCGVTFQLTPFLRIPILVLVGEQDVKRDNTVNRSRRIDAAQGTTRRSRAEAWVKAIAKASRRRGLPVRVSLVLLADCGHSFEQSVAEDGGRLIDRCTRFFFAQDDGSA